jgi:hypothetical protein
MAAVGMLAPFVETVLHRCFLGIGNRLYPAATPKEPHERWKATREVQWDCHFFIRSGRVEKNLAKGIVQLRDALGLTDRMPAEIEPTLSALFAYRNAMFHNGFEWPIEERESFARRIAEEWRSE